ncbi:MAG: hypothetical protein ABI887_05890 [Burkholderiales bacterium]
MVEVQRTPKAGSDLVDHANQQEVGEEQVALLEIVQIGHPDQNIQMEQHQTQVDSDAAPVPDTQYEPASQCVRQIRRDEPEQLRLRNRRAASPVLEQRNDAENHEARGSQGRDLFRVQAPRVHRFALPEQGLVEREAGVGVGRRGSWIHGRPRCMDRLQR